MALSVKQEAFVAAYIGIAHGNATEAARIAGYKGTAKTLGVIGAQNLAKPSIAERIDAYRAELKAAGIAHKQNRLDSYVDDFERTQRVIAARADHYKTLAPGGDTGLIVGQLKLVKHIDDTNEDGQRVWFEEQWEYVVDTALMNERLKVRKQIAQELGEWTEEVNVSGSLHREYVIVRDDAPAKGED